MIASLKSSVGLGQNIQILPSFSDKDGPVDIQMLIATTLHIIQKVYENEFRLLYYYTDRQKSHKTRRSSNVL
jgi:hypothetical protein